MTDDERENCENWIQLCSLVTMLEDTGKELAAELEGMGEFMRDLVGPQLVQRREQVAALIVKLAQREPVDGKLLQEYLGEKLRALPDTGAA